MPPRRKPSQQDVANRAGVSRTTVSFVLNDVAGVHFTEETRRRVLQAANELDYVPDAAAQALASRRSKIIGLVLTRNPHHIASDAFLSQVLDSLVLAVRQHGMRLILDIVEGEHHREIYLDLVRSKRIDGIIFSGPRFDDEALQTLEDEGFPTVLMGQLPGSSFSFVDVDNRAAAMKAVSHLIGLGHTRIACITNAGLQYTAATERLQGYREALEGKGIPFDRGLVRYGDFDLESGRRQMTSLLATEQIPTAVFIASDVVAFGAMTAIREHGLRIPDDIAIVSFDNVPMSRYIEPPLTTIHLPASELSLQASNMLIRLIQNEPLEQKQILLDTHLIVRESCGANRAAIKDRG